LRDSVRDLGHILSEVETKAGTQRVKSLIRKAVISGGLVASRAIASSGAMRSARGRGAIFTLHHVRPKAARSFHPNAHLEVTPDFLDTAIARLKRDGYRFIALADLPACLADGNSAPFAVFTLDDAYRNTLDHAAPVFVHHGVPFTTFATKGFVERTQSLWWETLGELLQAKPRLTFDFGTGSERVHLQTPRQVEAAFARFAAFVHAGDEVAAVRAIDVLARAEGLDPLRLTERLTLDADGLARLAGLPGADIGAHTVTHRALARLSDSDAEQEIRLSVDAVTRVTGTRPRTFAYPYGDARAVSGRDTRMIANFGLIGVTTCPGTVGGQIGDREGGGIDPAALPRISLNGHFQTSAHVATLASGIPFRLMRRG
jgi:peptidoglycan/xylan/chitin deacetylase (PgdA/CDA1 family)